MSKVFYFARYSQRENFSTNNTLLLMYRLYEQSRRQYQLFLTSLLDEKADAEIQEIGFQMRQQEWTPTSVLDGYLRQAEVRIGIEAKAPGAPFRLDQLLNHLDKFPDAGTGYLLLLRPNKEDLTHKQWEPLHAKANKKGVVVSSVTFQQIINSFNSCIRPHDDDLHELIDDFESFCIEENLLDSGETTIFAPPCARSLSINENNALYFCPSDWSRKSTRYLGIYANKSVKLIGEISKIAYCDLDDGQFIAKRSDGSPLDLNLNEKRRIQAAITEAEDINGWGIGTGHKFFLCDKLVKTDFRKVTPGGIMGHRYLDIGPFLTSRKTPTLDELAEVLSKKTWE